MIIIICIFLIDLKSFFLKFRKTSKVRKYIFFSNGSFLFKIKNSKNFFKNCYKGIYINLNGFNFPMEVKFNKNLIINSTSILFLKKNNILKIKKKLFRKKIKFYF